MSDPEHIYQSCFDLRWHFNPAAATEAGVVGQNTRLGDYDTESMRAHMAAFRSMAFAVEALELDDVEAEIDRTAASQRPPQYHFPLRARTTPRQKSHFWLSHLYQALYALLDRQDGPAEQLAADAMARLRAMPPFSRRLR